MLKKLQALDTTELLILVGVLGVLIFGGFHLYLRGRSRRARKRCARRGATSPRSLLCSSRSPSSYTASRAMTAGGEDINPASYFTRQFTNYAKLPYDSYTIDAPRPRPPRSPSRASAVAELPRPRSPSASRPAATSPTTCREATSSARFTTPRRALSAGSCSRCRSRPRRWTAGAPQDCAARGAERRVGRQAAGVRRAQARCRRQLTALVAFGVADASRPASRALRPAHDAGLLLHSRRIHRLARRQQHRAYELRDQAGLGLRSRGLRVGASLSTSWRCR
jgi:hypothetical protein